MKLQLLKIIKSPLLYIGILVLSGLIVSYIRFVPHRLENHVNTKGISYVVLEPNPYRSDKVIKSEENIEKFVDIIKSARYTPTFYKKYKWDNSVRVEIHYFNGSVISLGEHKICFGNRIVYIYSSNIDFAEFDTLLG